MATSLPRWRQLPGASDRLRRASILVLFIALGLLQGLAPLLHTHVTASVGSTQSGVHLPVAIAHAGHSGAAIDVICSAMDESGVITVPPELRRDPTPVPAPSCALHAHIAEVWLDPVASDRCISRTDLPGAEPPVLLPPAQGPPVSA